MIPYLDMIDALLTQGLSGLSSSFIQSQVAFVVSCQEPDGGFRGRMGSSDPYYTDFALRVLALLDPRHEAVTRATGYLSQLPQSFKDIIECFNLLNLRRLLGSCGQQVAIDEQSIVAVLGSYLLAAGGLAKAPGISEVSAYHTFLGALCYDCLRLKMPEVAGSASAVRALRRSASNGAIGFSESRSQGVPQTNATAAAVAFLGMQNSLSDEDLSAVVTFLAAMQLPDGGLKAHPAAKQSDLLSTFTGLLTLAMTERLDRIDVGAAARFIRSAAATAGGFRACASDAEADVEYTYYGLGLLALLRLFAQAQS